MPNIWSDTGEGYIKGCGDSHETNCVMRLELMSAQGGKWRVFLSEDRVVLDGTRAQACIELGSEQLSALVDRFQQMEAFLKSQQ